MPGKEKKPVTTEAPKAKKVELQVAATDILQLQSIVDKTTAEFIRELPQILKAKLEKHIASSLGFQVDDDGTWSVNRENHYNGVGHFIAEQAKSILGEHVQTILKASGLSDGQKAAVRDEFERKVKEEIKTGMAKHVRETALKVMESTIVGFEENAKPIKMIIDEKTAADPNYGNTELEKIALWALWQNQKT